MENETIVLEILEAKTDGHFSNRQVLPNEISGLVVEHFAMKGTYHIQVLPQACIYDVLLVLKGEGSIEMEGMSHNYSGPSIIRTSYKKPYAIRLEKGQETHLLRFRKSLDEKDLKDIASNPEMHSDLFIKAIADCPVYTEDIKSAKTINRMILPEGMVPRFCMGSVQTEGPDAVAEHEHPMLDQLFFGLDGCHCTCVADDEKIMLTENMLLHIPLGSKHAVSVDEGNILHYIWFDFFLTLEGQKYMNEQHHMEEE